MTLRATLIGIFLGGTIVAFEILKDKATPMTFIGSQLPVGVFGLMVLALLVWNPLAGRLRKGLALRMTEIAVIAALGLAACGWPSFMRLFTTVLAMPAHLVKSNAGWQAAQVMSYVPGASPQLADGFVRDWPGFLNLLAGEKAGPSVGARQRLWDSLPPETRALIHDAAGKGAPDGAKKKAILDGVNAALAQPGLYDPAAFAGIVLPGEATELLNRRSSLRDHEMLRLNRLVIDAAFPDVITPVPAGGGVLLADGRADPVALDLLIQGSSRRLGIANLPWETWWPALRLWAGAAILFSLAAVCLALIVHPQWSRRELLPYPVAKFVQEITLPQPGRFWPQVTVSKLFWIGFWAMILINTLDLLNGWLQTGVYIPLRYDFSPLKQLFPNAAKVPNADSVFTPNIHLGIIAFAFFLNLEVSFSLGLAGYLYLAVAGLLIANGVSVTSQGLEVSGFSLMVFGAYLASTVMILYIGRGYYLKVAASIPKARSAEVPDYAAWGARGLLVCCALLLFLLTRAGLDWLISSALIGMVLMIFLIVSRIYAETGALMVQAAWAPAAILLSVLGIEATGPTAYLMLAIAGSLFLSDTRATWMGFFVNALRIGDSAGETSPRRLVPVLMIIVVAGAGIALGTKFYSQYNSGVDMGDRWAVEWVPGGPFTATAGIISELASEGQLAEATARHGIGRLLAIHPQPAAIPWIAVGIALVTACTFARLRLPWWPIHPVLFLVWGTWAGMVFATSFFLGWLVKACVVKLGGTRSYHTVKPLMVGIIAGGMVIPIVIVICDIIYFYSTGVRSPWWR